MRYGWGEWWATIGLTNGSADLDMALSKWDMRRPPPMCQTHVSSSYVWLSDPRVNQMRNYCSVGGGFIFDRSGLCQTPRKRYRGSVISWLSKVALILLALRNTDFVRVRSKCFPFTITDLYIVRTILLLSYIILSCPVPERLRSTSERRLHFTETQRVSGGGRASTSYNRNE